MSPRCHFPYVSLSLNLWRADTHVVASRNLECLSVLKSRNYLRMQSMVRVLCVGCFFDLLPILAPCALRLLFVLFCVWFTTLVPPLELAQPYQRLILKAFKKGPREQQQRIQVRSSNKITQKLALFRFNFQLKSPKSAL